MTILSDSERDEEAVLDLQQCLFSYFAYKSLTGINARMRSLRVTFRQQIVSNCDIFKRDTKKKVLTKIVVLDFLNFTLYIVNIRK